MSTYTRRITETVTITKLDVGGITMSSGWSTGPSEAVRARLSVGKEVNVETRGLSLITGWLIDGEWVERKSDEDLTRERAEMVARFARERRERLDENRDAWQARTDALPNWIRARIESFRDAAGEQFDLDGWGYELVVAELAVMYAAADLAETPAISDYASSEGTSGSQHDMARALARAHQESPDQSLAGTVSALSPITGSADYR